MFTHGPQSSPTQEEILSQLEVKGTQEQEQNKVYQTNFTLELNGKRGPFQKTKGSVTMGHCIGFDGEEIEDSVVRGQFIAILNSLVQLANEGRKATVILHFNPQNQERVNKWIAINKDLLILPEFKGMIFCVTKTDEPLDKSKLGYEGQGVFIPDFRLQCEDWDNKYKFVKGLMTTDHEFNKRVTKDCERIANKHIQALGDDAIEEEVNAIKEKAKATVITEVVELIFLQALKADINAKVNVLFSTDQKMFSSFYYLEDQYGKDTEIAKEIGGRRAGSLKLCPVKFTELPEPVMLSFPNIKTSSPSASQAFSPLPEISIEAIPKETPDKSKQHSTTSRVAKVLQAKSKSPSPTSSPKLSHQNGSSIEENRNVDLQIALSFYGLAVGSYIKSSVNADRVAACTVALAKLLDIPRLVAEQQLAEQDPAGLYNSQNLGTENVTSSRVQLNQQRFNDNDVTTPGLANQPYPANSRAKPLGTRIGSLHCGFMSEKKPQLERVPQLVDEPIRPKLNRLSSSSND